MCLAVLMMGLTGIFGFGFGRAVAAVQFSAGLQVSSTADFYTPLSTCGAWVDLNPYGRCWRPTGVEADWRPYADGYWEWTDVGWYWVSDEPWGWACYHYGSWVYDANYGWVWIPGTEWAPAWVTWRQSPDYIGWAPCGPGGIVLAPTFFVFVDVHRFRHHRIHRGNVIVNNTTIINGTKVINNIRRETRNFDGGRQRVVVNQGPGADPIQRATGQSFTPRPLRDVVRETPAPEIMKRTRSPQGETERQRQMQPRERTGRDQPRIYEQQPQPVPQTPPPVARERPALRTTPPERALPPTGRQTPPSQVKPPRQQPPPARPPAAPPGQRGKEREKEKEEPRP